MRGIGGPELVFIFILALLIFGPTRLPQIGRTIGKGMAEFRRASTELQRAVNTELEEPATPAWRAQPAAPAPAAAAAAAVTPAAQADATAAAAEAPAEASPSAASPTPAEIDALIAAVGTPGPSGPPGPPEGDGDAAPVAAVGEDADPSAAPT